MREEYYETLMGGVIPTGLPGGFFIYEAGGDEKVIFAETNIVKLFGCDTYEEFLEFIGGTFKGMVHPDDLLKIENQIEAQTIYAEKRHDYVRYRIVTKQGEIRYVEDFGHLLHGANGKSFYYVFIVDVDQNEYLNTSRNSYAEAEALASNRETDELTGLFNMAFFYNKVQILLGQPDIRRQDVSFVHFDIPNFKLYNERHGFKMGDELLRDLGRTIKEAFVGATVARFSDDHFVVFTTLPKDEVVECVEEVYKSMLLSEDVNKKVKVKAGIYYMDDQRAEVGLACDHARLACNSIKNRHDVNYCIYDDIIRDGLRRQQFVVDHIDDAIANDYIKVFYQPIIRVKTGEICGYEALVRWVDPEDGMLPPGYFIETLEHFHLIHFVDEYVVKKVCQDYRRLCDEGEALVPFSVNVSRLDFEVCDVYKMLSDYCEIYDVPREMIDVEITESAFSDNTGLIKDACEKIREAGHEIWIDDFGSGYSSLTTLADYEFDVLKLDMVFLRSIDKNPKTKTLMNYIIKTSTEMGLSSLCEGVETKEHYQFLKDAGCEKAQGYYFGKPMPLDEMLDTMYDKGMQWELVKI
ncbi:sensor domain-containing phosphodiesterase [Pseudobutyrivibrio sp.]|uniref:sensor domain-containing phosphodiesterase n=1 Tax=Pseudobutyrivibrio sp. TaxID=2014367 RepID=UPI001B2342AB|nr:GGDEF and EAL domain-containing protein [Pseudobutyrivibrio sp.]MBO5617260.1 GGDEF and EAL domain-containing protein [Pseudobutyrivibrio sp.]MBP3262201.1 GGDEF and EAL domain-containing protein [Pseudobutyrivibrio sp.]